jgi:hypothetical protein
MKDAVKLCADPWAIHVALYPAVDGVLNPPFINPHLPKMYAICRDFVPYLSKEQTGSLVYVELMEYARRVKTDTASRPAFHSAPVDFKDIEQAISDSDPGRGAMLMSVFLQNNGSEALLRRLLLLGSGYLEQSIGHSVSCTAFILLELLRRSDVDAWPALLLLSDYFCKGGFSRTDPLGGTNPTFSMRDCVARSVTGAGFIDLHHTITLYAVERVKAFFSPAEVDHLFAAWVAFMGNKQADLRSFPSRGKTDDYGRFYGSFSQLDVDITMDMIGGMIASQDDRSRLCTFLIAGVCDLYQEEYDPHFLTSLGSLLWMINTYHENADIVLNALFQYLGFFFRGLKSKG